MDKNEVRLAPSILAADFAQLGAQVAEANVLVAGSAIFDDREGVAAAMKRLSSAMSQVGN
jgi:pentose-5-phosphate-3-epimerase